VPDDFGYINARLRGMHGRLVTARLEEALGAGSYGEFLRVLAETDLAADLGEATAQGATLADLDRAVSRNFNATARRILGFSSGEEGRLVSVLLERYDLHNLKALARGKTAGREPADIEASFLPAGSLGPGVLSRMAAAPDLPAVAQLLAIAGHPLARPFRQAATALVSGGDLLAFEVALDRAYYQSALDRADDETLLSYLRLEVDAANLLTAAKLRGQPAAANATAYFIDGGREVRRDLFISVSAGGAVESLRSFPGIGTADSLTDVEASVRHALLAYARRLYASDPLGIGVMIGYLKEKEREVALTRFIARGKFYGVPTETLRKELARGA
jgi:V/A-type H+-transporting ATPase subunit C